MLCPGCFVPGLFSAQAILCPGCFVPGLFCTPKRARSAFEIKHKKQSQAQIAWAPQTWVDPSGPEWTRVDP